MSTFTRSLPDQLLTDEVIERNPWFKDLLRHWRPPGDALHRGPIAEHALKEDPRRLRLAIRDGYVNFYRSGQAVARKVRIGGGDRLQALIHNKYVDEQEHNDKHYLRLTSAGVSNRKKNAVNAYRGTKDMDLWIEGANRHTGREKKFVDLVVARNPNTIDLEMALPAYSPNPIEQRSPRMDLVALEQVGSRWQIVFWEAKLVDDPRLRGKRAAAPKVVEQLKQYRQWLRHADHCKRVIAEYQKNCQLLVKLRELAVKVNPDIEKLGSGIVAVAKSAASDLLLDDAPRLLIDNRKPDPRFFENGNLEKLRGVYDLHVQLVCGLSDMTLGGRS